MGSYPFGAIAATGLTYIAPSGDLTGATDFGNINTVVTGGGRVVLGPGLYWINQTLQFATNSALFGFGAGISTIRAIPNFAATQVGANGGMVMACTKGNAAASHITVTGVTFDMNEQNIASVPGYATAALCAPLGFQNATGLLIDAVETLNAIGYSIFPLACTDVRIRGCRVITGQTSSGYGNQDGIHVTDCTGVSITGNYIDTGTINAVGDDGIAIQGVSTGCNDVTITGNVIERAAAHGIITALGGSTVTGVTIAGNTIANTRLEAILLAFNTFVASATYLATDIAITGNTMRNIATANTASGITLQDAFGGTGTHVGTAGYAAVTITGNILDGFTNTTGFGIYAQAGSDLTISDNTFRNWKAVRGIDIGDNTTATSRPVVNAVVSGNTIDMSTTTATAPAGIVVVDSPNPVVTDNAIIGAAGPIASSIGISLLSISTAITGHVINDNRTPTWATGISETNNGVAPNFGAFVGNNTHGCTAFISTVGVSDVVASNVVA